MHAQDAWINLAPTGQDSDNLTESEAAYLSELSELPYLLDPIIQNVLQENFGDPGAEKVVNLTLPGFKGVTTLGNFEHTTKNLGDFDIDVISGNDINSLIVGGGDPCFGHFFLTVENGNINGRINTAAGDFLIRALSDSKVVVFETNPSISTGCEECEGVQEGEGGHDHSSFKLGNAADIYPLAKKNDLPILSSSFQSERRCRIDFVAAVTPDAESNPGWAKSDALATESDMNRAIRNSSIENLSYRLVGFVELSTFSITNGTVPATALTSANMNQEILDIYPDYGADVVLVFYQNGGLEGVRGWSELGSAAPAERDLSLAEVNLTFQFTGVHELAHNHGCKHRADPTVGTIGELVLSARGHRIDPNDPDDDDTVVERTIMALNAINRGENNSSIEITGKRVLRFSNPDVMWFDAIRDASFPTGTVVNNNAAQMTVHSCSLADRQDPLIEGIHLDGPLRSSPGSIVRLYSDRTCNGGFVPVVTYEASVDGGPFVVFATGGASIGYTVPNNAVNFVQFRATITCNSGESYADIHTVNIRQPCGELEVFRVVPQKTNSFPASEINFEVLSTSQSKVNISWENNLEGTVQVSDLLGRVLWQETLLENTSESVINIEGERHGDIIIVSFSDGEFLYSKKIYAK